MYIGMYHCISICLRYLPLEKLLRWVTLHFIARSRGPNFVQWGINKFKLAMSEIISTAQTYRKTLILVLSFKKKKKKPRKTHINWAYDDGDSQRVVKY